jgi:hypothetical protein
MFVVDGPMWIFAVIQTTGSAWSIISTNTQAILNGVNDVLRGTHMWVHMCLKEYMYPRNV